MILYFLWLVLTSCFWILSAQVHTRLCVGFVDAPLPAWTGWIFWTEWDLRKFWGILNTVPYIFSSLTDYACIHSCQLTPPPLSSMCSEELKEKKKKRCSFESLWWIFCRRFSCLSFHLSLLPTLASYTRVQRPHVLPFCRTRPRVDAEDLGSPSVVLWKLRWSRCPSHAPRHRHEISKPAVPVNSFVLNNSIAAVDGKHFIPASSGAEYMKNTPCLTFQKVQSGLYKSSIIFS